MITELDDLFLFFALLNLLFSFVKESSYVDQARGVPRMSSLLRRKTEDLAVQKTGKDHRVLLSHQISPLGFLGDENSFIAI